MTEYLQVFVSAAMFNSIDMYQSYLICIDRSFIKSFNSKKLHAASFSDILLILDGSLLESFKKDLIVVETCTVYFEIAEGNYRQSEGASNRGF